MATQIGAQMFTVQDYCKRPSDIARTCQQLKKIGYGAVQASALGPIDTAELKKILDGEGLICASTHMSLEELNDTDKCLSYHQTLDCHYTALGGFHSDRTEDWSQFAKDFTDVARKLADGGLHVGYHNHSHEWALLDTSRPINILTEQCGPEVYFEIDTYWVAHAGADPSAWINVIAALGPGRIPSVHLKDIQISAERQQKMSEVGAGNLNWPAILAACRNASVQWYLVERDAGDLDPFESLKISLDNLRAMGLE